MGLGRYLVDAIVLEGRSPSELAHKQGLSRSWMYELLAHSDEGAPHGRFQVELAALAYEATRSGEAVPAASKLLGTASCQLSGIALHSGP